MQIDSATSLCCLIGYPIGHSVSPQMHNAAFTHLNLNFCYTAFEVKSADLPSAIYGARAFNVRGLNVTVPHKVAVIPLLDEIDLIAKRINAVNTILNMDGKLKGYNTDGIGALEAIGEESMKDKAVVILGAGGASRAIAATLQGVCRQIIILNRSTQKAVSLAKELEKNSQSTILGLPLSKENIQNTLNQSDVLINTTTVGMYPNISETLIDKRYINSGMTVFDIIYNPFETQLLKDAKSQGAHTIGGLDMLVHQGAASSKIWTGIDPPVNVMKEAAIRALKIYEVNKSGGGG